jgi:NAD(P)-dependent dehydrogenase (short-subunit alcohol dehydrogenase family)
MKKVVMITGSATGIGQATAYAFAKAGYDVIVTHYNQQKEGNETVKLCLKFGAPSALLVSLDITSEKSIKAALTAVKKKYGKIDVLVNNAGVLVFKPFIEQTTKDIEFQVRTNLEGTIRMTMLALPLVTHVIVNVASQVGSMPYPNCAVYSATKWGIRGFTKTLALEQPQLKMFAVNPGATATPMSGFQGIPPSKVADLILAGVEGKHEVESGGDIDVWKIYSQNLP